MQQKYRICIGILCVAVLLGGMGWYVGSREDPERDQEKLTVVATFFPLADFARSVGGNEVEVIQITPDGVEPHDYEPSPQDVAEMISADVVLINGGGVDAWAEDLIPDAKAAGASVVLMSDVVPFIESSEQAWDHEEEKHEEEEEDEHGHDEGADPHAWLDLARAQEMVRAISEALIVKDKARVVTYATNADTTRAALAALDTRFSATLSSCKSHTVLVAHDAFHYWELRYNINMEAIAGISPEAEPSVKDIAELIEKAKVLGVTTVFFESPASTGLANTLAAEIGAMVDVLSPLEGRTEEEIAAAETYTNIMEKNLFALARALSCTAL